MTNTTKQCDGCNLLTLYPVYITTCHKKGGGQNLEVHDGLKRLLQFIT